MASDGEGDVETEAEVLEVSSHVPEPPQAVISGIQFGLFSNADIVKLSVCPEKNPVEASKKLSDPRFGLPTTNGICGTCNAARIDSCQGHFGHCVLPQLIFHPNHVGKLVAVLRKVCLKCGRLKKKKGGKLAALLSSPKTATKQPSEDYANGNGASTSMDPPSRPQSPIITIVENGGDNQSRSAAKNKRKIAEVFIDKEARVARGVPISSGKDPVILLSSDDEATLSDGIAGADDENGVGKPSTPIFSKWNTKTSGTMADEDDDDLEIGQSSPVLPRRSTRKRKSVLQTDPPSVATVVDLTNGNEWDSFSPTYTTKGEKRQRMEKGKSSHHSGDIPTAIPVKATPPAKRKCKYCAGSSLYPEILLKVEVSGKNNNEVLFKMIKMVINVKNKDTTEVAPDFWTFIEPQGHTRAGSPKPDRFLLPSEALEILNRIPKNDAARLGMHPDVAWPESLIVKNIPVPPNCTRILDEAINNSNLGLKLGVDRATAAFSKILNKIAAITKSRYRDPLFPVAVLEAAELQSLFGAYLREKGAPKAVPGKEKLKIDHVGRVEKRDSRWSLEWLKRHVLGKRGAYSARNVLTGDPFLRVEEIGIPQFVAKHVTIPERVNKLNQERLQQCVYDGQNLVGRYRACGAVRILRNGEGLEITKATDHQVQVGDIVDRHLKDGDLVYVNRPPSLHKHSLLGLKVHVIDLPVFTINPAVCAPLHADFDGDCLHLFVPQSEEARAELQQLMTLPEQILPSLVGKTILGMSQDSILATHLMTASPVFLTKEVVHQLSMWSSKDLPVPTIIKSPKGARWSGKQIVDLTIPKDFSLETNDGSVRIEGGELISYGGNGNWLTSTKGLVCNLAQYNNQAAVDHLDCAQSIMREYLLSRGFSLSLEDFYAAPDYTSRSRMIQSLKKKIRKAAELAIRMELLFDEKFQKMDVNPESFDPQSTEALEEVSIGYFQERFSDIGEEMGSMASSYNQLLAMVRAGSKGSLSKVLHQIGCFGLQLQKGERLVRCEGNTKLMSLAQSMLCDDKWECQGLVKNSLLDGLDPMEYFFHSIAVRAALLRQSLEVTEPGELFKNLMLFLRDIHVAYDGTVRNKCGSDIIQFSYEGAVGPDSVIDVSRRGEVVMPGEPVGILAATAIAQPAYQVMLEANHNVGSQKIRPLELLQSTIFPRKAAKLKAGDRRSILRLQPCSCLTRHCDELRALEIKSNLIPLSIETVATAVAIEYLGEDSAEWAEYEEDMKIDLPWIGHVRFDEDLMVQNKVGIDHIEETVRTAFRQKSLIKLMHMSNLKKPIFFSRKSCECMGGGPCLHFSATVRSKKGARRTHETTSNFVSALRDGMMPLILTTCIKGDERVESVRIIWEEAVWSPCLVSEDGERRRPSGHGELVVDVLLKEKTSMARGSPWGILKDLLFQRESIDWNRSAPYSVQEIQHAFGVEAARDSILQRLTLATQAGGASVQSNHLKLVADLMVRSGEVIGLTSAGYRDLMKSLKTSAPFTSGAFRAPIKTFMEAAEKGEEETLCGVLATNIFGKRVPVGTGADFCLKLEPKTFPRCAMEPQESVDILELLGDLRSKIKAEFPEEKVEEYIPQAFEEGVANGSADEGGDWMANQNTGGDWETNGDAGAWGTDGTSNENTGAWGTDGTCNENTGAWGTNGPSNENNGDWGASDNAGTWGANTNVDEPDTLDNWGNTSEPVKASDGWGCSSAQWEGTEGDNGKDKSEHSQGEDWGSVPAKDADDGAWGGLPAQDAEATAWNDSPPKDSEAGGWGTETHDDGLSGELSVDLQVDKDEGVTVGSSQDKGDAGNEWGHQPQWDGESVNDGLNARGRREFRPTGANTIPLGKVRQFKHMTQANEGGGVSLAPTPVSRVSLTKEPPLDAEPVIGNDGDTWGADPSLTTTQEDDSGWGTSNMDSGWAATPVQDGSSDFMWQSNDDTNAKDAATDRAPGFVRRALDSRKDSKAWDEVIEKVRLVRTILQSHLPGEELDDPTEKELLTETFSHHPTHAEKIGCGIKFFKVGHAQKAAAIKPTKCFFLVRNDNSQDDFSYHKCLHNMAKNMNPPLDDLYEVAFMRRRFGDVPSFPGPREATFN